MIVNLFRAEPVSIDYSALFLNLPIDGIERYLSISFPIITDVKKDDRFAWLITLLKWRFIRDYIKEHNIYLLNGGRDTCGLCMSYTNRNRTCTRCPIGNYGYPGCRNTPYDKYGNTQYIIKPSLKYAREELKFLFKVYKQWKKDNPKGDMG